MCIIPKVKGSRKKAEVLESEIQAQVLPPPRPRRGPWHLSYLLRHLARVTTVLYFSVHADMASFSQIVFKVGFIFSNSFRVTEKLRIVEHLVGSVRA